MSGGPQVFLGATTFCLIASPPDLRPPRGLPARSPSALRASLGASSRSPARPCHRPRALQPGPAGLAAASNRAALGMTRPGPAGLAAASNRAAPPPTCTAVRPRRPRDDRLLNNVARNSRASISNTEIASLELQRFEHILKTDRGKLRATFARGYIVPRRADSGTPLADAVRSLWPTQIRPPSASTAPRRCMRRS